MPEAKLDEHLNNIDITSHWLYPDMRQIIILPDTLLNLTTFLKEVESVKNDERLINVIEKCMESLFSIQATQRIKLLDFIIDKATKILQETENKNHLKALVTLAYCIIILSYRDENRFKSEVLEIKHYCHLLSNNILSQISIKTESNEYLIHLYMFLVIFIKQLSLWITFNDDIDNNLQTISLNKLFKKRSDSTSKALYFLYRKVSLPLEEISLKSQRPFHHLLLLSFHSCISVESIENDFISKPVAIKREFVCDNIESSPKRIKLKSSIDFTGVDLKIENVKKLNDQLTYLATDITEGRQINNVLLINIFKMTPDIMLLTEKDINNSEIDSSFREYIFINLLKLWTFGIKQKLLSQFDYNIYYCRLVCKEIQGKTFKLQINAVLDFIMAFQSKFIVDVLSTPAWVNQLIINSIECIITNSTNDKNLSESEQNDIVNLINEVGKCLEVLLQAKNLRHLCRVIVVIPRKLFTFISDLKAPLYPAVRRTIGKNIIKPIITVLNKHTLEHMKMELKGAAREVCRDFLEIK